jgi:hypothetical protein
VTWLHRPAARCGCRTATTQDMYVPSSSRGGGGTSSHGPTRSIGTPYEDEDDDEDDKDVDPRQEEIGTSQLHDAPSTQPTQQVGTRRRRPPQTFTLGTDALGHKGKGKTRRQ